MVFGLFCRKTASATATARADAGPLRAHIQSIPPQTLHAYTIDHLRSVDPAALDHLSAFFADLVPPPQLHCVRCHKPYFDIENTDRSCLVAHDDESAEVERVSAKDTLYETLWNCCGKTVEGDGDMGPPDGWCYEGMHTTDTKRARFRADSTMHDDKLVSCERLRCAMPPRKRRRPVEGDDDGDGQYSVTSSHPSTNPSPRSSNSRKKPRTRASPQHDDASTPPMSSSPDPKPRPCRSKPPSIPKQTTSSPPVVVPPFVSRPSSPDHLHPHTTNKDMVQVVIMSSPERPRLRKDGKDKARATGTVKRDQARRKALEEVVDSSVDAERAARKMR